ncbi:MAG: PspC domain-containing protein [Chloroflexi bacterium]|nr:PspC domain-containing protein [Chloroflexota bacterium]
MTQRLYRSQVDRMLTGVAGGMAEYLRVDPVIVRMLWVIAVFLSSGVGLLVYVTLAIVMPTAPPLDDDAEAQRAEGSQPATPARYAHATNGAALVVGSVLVIIGAAALMSQFGWFDAWRLWPLILIAIGGVLIFNQRR